MAVEPPQPPGPAWWPGRRPADERGADGRGRRRWPRASSAAWRRVRTLPSWAQALLWLVAWPVAAALYVASRVWLGRLAPPLTAVVLLVGSAAWWGEPLTADGHAWPRARATATAGGWDGAWTGPAQTALAAGDTMADLPEFDPSTLRVELHECVQTRSVSNVRDRTIRQPRLTLRVTNLGPERTVVLHAAMLLDAYAWNSGWKPTAPFELELRHGQTAEATLMTNYRHQASYTPDGLGACALNEVEIIAPQLWPEYPPSVVAPLRSQVVAAPERPFDPRRDLLRSDAR